MRKKQTIYICLVVAFLFGSLLPTQVQAHEDDKKGPEHVSTSNNLENLFIIEKGATLSNVTEQLEEEGLIGSEWWYKVVHRFLGRENEILPGGFALTDDMSAFVVRDALQTPQAVWVELPENGKRIDVTEVVGKALGWDEREKDSFRLAHTGIQWDHFNSVLIDSLGEIFEWQDIEQKAFMTMGARYSDPRYDFLGTLYVPGEYLIPVDESQAQIAARLVNAYEEKYAPYTPLFLAGQIDTSVIDNVYTLVTGEVEDLPDLIPLPARDVGIEIGRRGQTLLVFTTTYWNDGDGPLELIVNLPSTPLTEDINRDVFQRIYKSDGSFRDTLAGNFLWHAEHLHYHFDDFVNYILEPVDVDGEVPESEPLTKATFCIRDVEPVHENIPLGSLGDYSVCGFKRQGISVGWGDSYFFTYADQFIDVTDLPSGTYNLSFDVNPEGILVESDMSNNKSILTIYLDTTNKTVEVI